METPPTYHAYAAVVAPKYHLPPKLVEAIIEHESECDRFAHRIEPAYAWLWNVRHNVPFTVTPEIAAHRLPPADFPEPSGISRETEWIDQQSSWGLMQVMGAVAREQGFTGPMPGLCDPIINVNHGCQLLQKRAHRYLDSDGWAGVLESYNAGHPGTEAGKAYMAQVLAKAGVASIEALTA